LAFGEVGEADEHHVERARRLARPDHVDVERGEDLGVLGERVGERRSLVHLLPHDAEDALEARVLDLLDQRGERIDQGDARADEGGELPGGNGRSWPDTREPKTWRRSTSRERPWPLSSILPVFPVPVLVPAATAAAPR